MESTIVTAADTLVALRTKICQRLSSLVTSDYYLLEIPHHSNIGDYLIWQGEIDFLKTLPYKCLGMHAYNTFGFPRLDPRVTILMNGGGSFGDVWIDSLKFKMSVIDHYKDNKIIFFPQSVQFDDKHVESEVLGKLERSQNVYICARDRYSYDLLVDSCHERVLLVPDMAFFADVLHVPVVSGDREMAFFRGDREYRDSKCFREICADRAIEKVDWAVFINGKFLFKLFMGLDFASRWFGGVVDWVALNMIRPYLIKEGIRLLNGVSLVHTARMHGGILAIMLGRDVRFYDNSYGKISRFFFTWLSECESAKLES